MMRMIGVGAAVATALATTTAFAQAPARVSARVRGEIVDSVRSRRLSGATVQLTAADGSGRILSTTSTSQGTFQLDDVATGVYLVGFLHPFLDSLGVESQLLRLDVTNGDPIVLTLATPSAATLIEARCGAPAPELPRGMFFGTVRTAGGSPPPVPARVRAQYNSNRVTARGLERVPNVRIATGTADGAFAVCGVPPNTAITVRAFADLDSSGFVELPVPGNGLLLRDLVIGRGVRQQARGTGGTARVTSVLTGKASLRGIARNQSGQPVNGARITLWGTGVETSANAAGQYQFTNLPEGTYTVEARAVGFQPHRAPADLQAAREAVVDLTLSALVTNIDTLRVRANRAVPLDEFERRRKLGFGHFLTEEEIRKKGPTYMGDIFRGLPGVVTMPGQFGRDRVLVRGTGMTGDCAPAIFLNGLYVNIEDGDLDNIINPKDVRAIELYARTASIPLQFQTRNGCGSAVIWTGARMDDPPVKK
ncbi:carboxypeptidase regulatory-like domain-containing protein [Gemmatimonas sp.]|uniref:carboxypeptidase regulatory-like domain-containing protein n=1 Tax=Gemmatimonas sp. TaxID=1962908 RepID=UPI0022C8FAC1|nr:carboxypeptidase regulatory-like domain-containing protein [Gemmatimonas sp.]MCA2989498.1 carboxypeptidase regulatory-like domain-containing protein [Gemmatimonas sp.]MCE2952960.1 Plug and carboxypeptidase regulatory-like domain-containing protein [Gemmatimonas sp.]MCZ8011787.1 carboxypeptidase regulatory-like domain-containing protein [Gemmatimonas sp.]MCZ8265664.1 carboxypeptidase regulatory-like domain-containing protein [Gemmatimonas sp.]